MPPSIGQDILVDLLAELEREGEEACGRSGIRHGVLLLLDLVDLVDAGSLGSA